MYIHVSPGQGRQPWVIFALTQSFSQGPRAKSYSIGLDFESLFLGPYISETNINLIGL